MNGVFRTDHRSGEPNLPHEASAKKLSIDGW
jgi:hypothetical protein